MNVSFIQVLTFFFFTGKVLTFVHAKKFFFHGLTQVFFSSLNHFLCSKEGKNFESRFPSSDFPAELKFYILLYFSQIG